MIHVAIDPLPQAKLNIILLTLYQMLFDESQGPIIAPLTIVTYNTCHHNRVSKVDFQVSTP